MECIGEGLREVNELLYTKAGRKARDRLPRLVTLLAALCELLEVMGISLSNARAMMEDMRAVAL